jgi:hypothetical protein
MKPLWNFKLVSCKALEADTLYTSLYPVIRVYINSKAAGTLSDSSKLFRRESIGMFSDNGRNEL